MGLSAIERRIVDDAVRRQDPANPHRSERCRRASVAVEGCRKCSARHAAQRCHRRDGREAGGARRDSIAVQQLQDSADEKPGKASYRRSGASDMSFLEWAIDPWGLRVPIHIAWFLIWVAVIAGLAFFIFHATYLRYFAKQREFASENPAPVLSAIPARVPQHSQVARLFHWIMAASMLTLLFTAFL